MSIIKADAVQDAAQALGLKAVREDVATALAADAEYRIREILQEALNFRRHSRRRKLTVLDM
jgi:transcription initiation factor TFIID subunit 6